MMPKEVRWFFGVALIAQSILSWVSDAATFGVRHVSHPLDRVTAATMTFVTAASGLALTTTPARVVWFAALCTGYILFGLSCGMLKEGGKHRALFEEYQYWHIWWHISLPAGAAFALGANSLVAAAAA